MDGIIGRNPQLLNVSYRKPNKKNGVTECFQVTYLDDTGVPMYTELKANVTFYVVKEEFRNFSHNKPQERIDRMTPITCEFSNIRREIAKQSEWGRNLLETAYQTNDYKMLDQLYLWPYAFGADFQPEFYFMREWYKEYKLESPKLTKAFLDIEVDMMDYLVDLDDIPNTAFAPVNCASLSFEDATYSFILRPRVPPRQGRNEDEYKERYRMYEKQLADHNALMSNLPGFYEELHEAFDPTYGRIEYHVREYEKEIDLIADIFRCINSRKPNFCLMWNMRFDIQYLYYRVITLGFDPASIMCHPDFKNPTCYFKADKSTFQLNKQYDYFNCSSYTMYMCQMRNYASIRKSQHALRRVTLNAISDIVLKDKKVDYPEDANIITFPYTNWRRFIIYNEKDECK